MNSEFLNNIWQNLVFWSEAHGLKVLILLLVALIIYRLSYPIIKKLIVTIVKKEEDLTKEEEFRREETLIRIFSGTIKVITVIVFALMILSEMGINIGPLIAGAGIIGLAVGFGGQYIVRDIITGLFIILENQYRVGDSVTISGISGSVEDITLRVTVLRDLNGTVHHIPHGEVTTVSNKAKGFARVNLDIGVSYDNDIEKVKEVINKVGAELANDPEFKESIIKAPEFVRVNEFADSSVVVKILGEVKPLKQWEIAGELRKRLKVEFDKEGIEIPYPQVVMRSK